MDSHLMIGAPGATYTPRLVAIAGDRLIHPADPRNDLARIVLRWERAWVPETWAARQYFAALGIGDDEAPRYTDQDVTGWLLLQPRPGDTRLKAVPRVLSHQPARHCRVSPGSLPRSGAVFFRILPKVHAAAIPFGTRFAWGLAALRASRRPIRAAGRFCRPAGPARHRRGRIG
ncbi:hypothetical protein A4R44_07250 [Amycolatopsis sp. M39]|nr:hypothetical protein A4R44_07250 [Amycolatopsis sp. M39]